MPNGRNCCAALRGHDDDSVTAWIDPALSIHHQPLLGTALSFSSQLFELRFASFVSAWLMAWRGFDAWAFGPLPSLASRRT